MNFLDCLNTSHLIILPLLSTSRAYVNLVKCVKTPSSHYFIPSSSSSPEGTWTRSIVWILVHLILPSHTFQPTVRELDQLFQSLWSDYPISIFSRMYVKLTNYLNTPHLFIPLHTCLQKVREVCQLCEPLIWSSHPVFVSRKCVNFVNCFRLVIWVLWLKPFSNRFPNPTSKLNDSGWINCNSIICSMHCGFCKTCFFGHYRHIFVVKPASAFKLSQTEHCCVWTLPPRKNIVLTVKLFKLH